MSVRRGVFTKGVAGLYTRNAFCVEIGTAGTHTDQFNMLKLETTTSSAWKVTQINTSPSVYLDHWALREISADSGLCDSFCEAIKGRDGMVEISWINLLDFSGVSDLSQVKAAEDFLDRLSPHNIGFINANVQSVVDFENNILRNERIVKDPHVDYELLKAFALHRSGTMKICSFKGFFLSIQKKRQKLDKMRRSFLYNLSDRLTSLRAKVQQPERLKNLQKTPKGHPAVQHLTRYIVDEVTKYILRGNMGITSNDWCDIHHAMVPLAYCDFVLLDQRWHTIMKQIQDRLRKAKHDKKMAEVFCGRNLNSFLEKLSLPQETSSRTLLGL